MRTLIAILTLAPLLAAHATVGNDVSDHDSGTAILTRTVVIPDKGEGQLPFPAEGQIFPCAHVGSAGYQIICRDSQGHQRTAYLPFRNEWGHLTAAAWTHDGRLAPNTLRIVTPVALRPGTLTLAQGTRYPMLGGDERRVTIRYSIHETTLDIAIPRDQLQIEKPAPHEADPLQRRLRELEASLGSGVDENAALQTRLVQAEADNARMMNLLRAVAQYKVENKALAAEVKEAERIRSWLSEHQPGAKSDKHVNGDTLEAAMQQRAEAAMQQATAQLETEPLLLLLEKIGRAETDLTRLSGDARKGEAELRALVKAFTDEDMQDEKERSRKSLQSAVRRLSRSSEDLERTQLQRDQLGRILAEIDTIREEGSRVREQLIAVEEELAALRKKLPKPAPAPEPAAESVVKRAVKPAPKPAAKPAPAAKPVPVDPGAK